MLLLEVPVLRYFGTDFSKRNIFGDEPSSPIKHERRFTMAEKPIKVDEQTDRLVTDLAHFLRSTKKSIVRDAVAEFAESRHDLRRQRDGIAQLTPLERLALRRRELIREFERHRGTNIRVLDASEGEDDELTLLVETDPIDGGMAAPRLADVARRLLATHVTVISLTALELMRPERHRRALAESRPL